MDTDHRLEPRLAPHRAAQPLSTELRERFERSTGADLRALRLVPVATIDAPAPALCEGDVIYRSSTAPEPSTPEGRLLIAHEVVHCLQQRAGRVPAGAGLLLDPMLEAEAQALAPRLLDGLPVELGRVDGRPRPGTLQPYTIIPQAQLANQHINLNTATFPGVECGSVLAAPETFLTALGAANTVARNQNAVDLRLSTTQEMAIEHTNVAQRQVRCFFASDMVIQTSNIRLQMAGSSFRLAKVDDGNGGHRHILVGNINPKSLYQVTATLANGNSTDGGSVNCDDVAGNAMGEPSRHKQTAKISQAGLNIFHGLPKWNSADDIGFRLAVLVTEFIFNGHDASAAKQSSDSGFTNRFNQAMQNAGNNPVAQIQALGQVFGPVGEFYGTLVRRALAHQQMHRYGRTIGGAQVNTRYLDMCRKLGINAWAAPSIGEAYFTYSVGKIEKYQDGNNRTWNGMEDFVAPRPLGGGRVLCQPVWEFHWGGVVAESGAERITFENYARNYEDRDAPHAAGQESRHFFQMSHVPSNLTNTALNGQSWHEACYATGFANALTMAIARMSKCGR